MEDDDAESVAWTEVSQSDQLVFTMLSNSRNIDRGALPGIRPYQPERIDEVTEGDDDSVGDRVEDITGNNDSYREDDRVDGRGDDGHEDVDSGQIASLMQQLSLGEAAEHASGEYLPFDGGGGRGSAYDERGEPPADGEEAPHDYGARADSEAERSDDDEGAADTTDDAPRPSTAPPPVTPGGFDQPLPFAHDESNDEFAKRSVLADLREMEAKGVRLTKAWTMADSLDEMTLEMRRQSLAMDEKSNVGMMRDGLRMLVTGVELLNNRFKLLDLEGWSAEVCNDLPKHDANLARIYRKYCRRGVSRNPEMEIAMSLVGSMGFHHMKRSMARQILKGATNGGRGDATSRSAGPPQARRGARRQPLSQDDEFSSSDDEAPPPSMPSRR